MASIKKRGNSYQVTVSNGYTVDKKKITETDTFTPEPGMTEKQIQKALNEFVVDFERSVKDGKNIKGERMTFKALSDKYLKDMQSELARTTFYDYKKRLELRLIPAIGHMKINTIRQNTINSYSKMISENYNRKDRKTGSISDASIKKDCAVVSAILSYAVGEGYLDMNYLIYSGKQKRRNKASKETKLKYFTIEQLIRFIDAMETTIPVPHKAHKRTNSNNKSYNVPEYIQFIKLETKWKLYFYIALFCGDRRGENISLKWCDFNFSTNEIEIGNSTDYVEGKMQLKGTKTDNIRINTVPAYVMDIARKLKKEEQERCLAMGDRWEGYTGKEFDKNFVFTQGSGAQMHITSPYRKYKTLIRLYNNNVVKNEENKIPDDVPPHGLRHSAAAILIANNLDARTVADILGHSDPTTTLNIYSYFFKNKGKEASKIMENILLQELIVVK